MDTRGVQRLLEKTLGMADTALAAGAKSTTVMLRDARLSDPVKAQLISLYGEEALRRTMNYAGLGLAICRVVEQEVDDGAARGQLDEYRKQFKMIYDTARAAFDKDFGSSHALEPR
jgi:hypothetical protein